MLDPHLPLIGCCPGSCTSRTEDLYPLLQPCQPRSGKKRPNSANNENLRLWQCKGAAA